MTRDGCGEDVAVYLLGALAPEDTERFERHLAGCELCRADVERLRPAVDALPISPETVAPPPELKERIMAEVTASIPKREARAARPAWLRPLPALAAACVLLVAGIGVGVAVTDGGPDEVVTGTVAGTGGTAELQVDDGDARLRVRGLPAAGDGRVWQVWVVRRGQEAPEATDALFEPTSGGRASVDVDADMSDVERVMVSREPRGGSEQPTSVPAIDIRM